MPGLLEEFPLVRVRWEGEQEQTQESLDSLAVGFVVAVFAMFVLLTMEFKSYFQPLLILAIIPFGCAGAVFGHALMGMPLTLFSMFGLVALSGVVVNDSIVLIDFINARVREGKPLRQALREAGCVRFRPVFLTSITTIGGLLPLLFETSFQAQFLIPMATALAFGLATTTLLVLVLVPVMYSFFGTSAREEHEEEYGAGTTAGSSVDPDEAEREWLPDHLREPVAR
jgi:multidrug efflux pump subunit AcrB